MSAKELDRLEVVRRVVEGQLSRVKAAELLGLTSRQATGGLVELRFVEAESAFDYFAATRAYLDRHGRPAAFYHC